MSFVNLLPATSREGQEHLNQMSEKQSAAVDKPRHAQEQQELAVTDLQLTRSTLRQAHKLLKAQVMESMDALLSDDSPIMKLLTSYEEEQSMGGKEQEFQEKVEQLTKAMQATKSQLDTITREMQQITALSAEVQGCKQRCEHRGHELHALRFCVMVRNKGMDSIRSAVDGFESRLNALEQTQEAQFAQEKRLLEAKFLEERRMMEQTMERAKEEHLTDRRSMHTLIMELKAALQSKEKDGAVAKMKVLETTVASIQQWEESHREHAGKNVDTEKVDDPGHVGLGAALRRW